jgi:hypothetical protein
MLRSAHAADASLIFNDLRQGSGAMDNSNHSAHELMIFELVGGPHDGSSLEAYPGIIQQHLYDPDSEMEILAPLEIVTETRVHRYVRGGQSQKLLYQGLV